MFRESFRGVLLLCLLQESLISQPRARNVSEFKAEITRGQADRQNGRLVSAVEHFHTAATLAAKNHDAKSQAQAMLYASGAEIRLFRYQSAIESAESAKGVALAISDNTLAGAAANNIAAIYLQLGANVLAAEAAQEAIRLLEHSARKDYLVKALVTAGDSQSELRQASAKDDLQRGVQVARQAGLKKEEALALNHLGQFLLDGGDLSGAAKTLEDAKVLETELQDESLTVTDFTLAQVSMKEGKYQDALQRLDRARRVGGQSLSTIPAYYLPQLRGEILMGLGQNSEALSSLANAVKLADSWRQSALPGDITNAQTVATLDRVYRDYVELSAELSLERHDRSLAREALTVLAKSRAADLREQMIAALGRRMQLPPRYFELLSELQDSEATLLGTGPKQSGPLTVSLQRIRNELSELQNEIGISQANSFNFRAKNGDRELLASVQRCLGDDELLLSFSLGKKKSFLWGVLKNRLELYELPPENVIAGHAAAYFAALQKGRADREGAAMSADLISQLPEELARKREWLIAADGVLLDKVPFPALPVGNAPSLVQVHSVRFLPSELLLLNQQQRPPASRFIGVADPIYNSADSRLGGDGRGGDTREQGRNRVKAVILARLFGSGVEVRAASTISGLQDVQLLTGVDATEAKLRDALKKPPTVLHFAVHVISATNEKWRSFAGAADDALALSLTPRGIPELLTKEAIAGLRVPGALVVLSGCASQQGEIVPSAGLMGLSRAWLLAGASAVIVTSWPTPDDSGGFFSDFYKRLKAIKPDEAGVARRAARALQQTQEDMKESTDYRSSTSFWGAYSIIADR